MRLLAVTGMNWLVRVGNGMKFPGVGLASPEMLSKNCRKKCSGFGVQPLVCSGEVK